MDQDVKFDTVNYETYKSAKSTRPAWANALIVAVVVFIAAVPMWVFMGATQGLTFVGIALLIALIAGVLALAGIKKA